DKLERAARDAADSLGRPRLTDRELARIEEKLEALAGRAHHVGVLVGLRDPRDLGDALVVLTRVGPKRLDLDGVGRLGRMYKLLAERLDLEVEVLDDHRTTDPPEDTVS